MRTLQQWFEQCQGSHRPWLILGKGRSFHLSKSYDLSGYHTLALNHAVREQGVTAAHLIDFDVFLACEAAIERNAGSLLMPMRPHVKNRPGSLTLPAYIRRHPTLAKLEREGRLVGYHLSTAGEAPEDGGPVITVRFFSAEAALRILAVCGARQVRSLGVDGGREYSEEFADLQGVTLLSNRRSSFDDQFEEIASILCTTQIEYAPLHLESPIRVFVGTTASQELAFRVLEYSIRRHTSMTTQVVPMRDVPVPLPRAKAHQPRTPFSFSRFLIPSLAGHAGKAIYLDADMLVFRDLTTLWSIPFDGADVMYVEERKGSARIPQFSVMVLNCETLHWDLHRIVADLDLGRYTYEELMQEFCIVPRERVTARLPRAWNMLERYHHGDTALLHYTDMPRQPWVSSRNRWGHLWVAELLRAIEAGWISRELVEREVALGHVRPSLLTQLRWRRPRGGWWWGLRDAKFVGPYRQLLKGRRPAASAPRAAVREHRRSAPPGR